MTAAARAFFRAVSKSFQLTAEFVRPSVDLLILPEIWKTCRTTLSVCAGNRGCEVVNGVLEPLPQCCLSSRAAGKWNGDQDLEEGDVSQESPAPDL